MLEIHVMGAQLKAPPKPVENHSTMIRWVLNSASIMPEQGTLTEHAHNFSHRKVWSVAIFAIVNWSIDPFDVPNTIDNRDDSSIYTSKNSSGKQSKFCATKYVSKFSAIMDNVL